MQPKVWRFVGFASAVVGLLYYGLCSSFNYLSGDWNLLKIFLYSVVSIIVSPMVLFAMIWKHSRTIRFKAQTAFLSHLMCFLRCHVTQLVEIDLLYCFLGCLMVQLLKIKLQLFIFGAGFRLTIFTHDRPR
ncbi:transmembrane protein, putative [Medicago truncatula]|uniref:Transmembrane protein, putative n=1 Tax=Medicago truncatula TaxID=3880 RepID=G7JZS0_MEDTR|nr:transmembrane protein, putative [Medicago truncatula]